MSRTALSFVLMFDTIDSNALEEASSAIARLHGSSAGVMLGPGSLPHLTLLQIDAAPSEAEQLWSEASSVRNPTVELTFAGLCLLPAPDDSEVWVEVPALKSDALDELQHDLMSLPMVQGRRIFNGVGDGFRPHVTLSLLSDAPQAISIRILSGALLRRKVQGHLALGINGENYSLVKILHRSGG